MDPEFAASNPTKCESTVDQKTATVHGALFTIPSRNSNQSIGPQLIRKKVLTVAFNVYYLFVLII
jgi:hypothetical protein